jgi:hypothetical protein
MHRDRVRGVDHALGDVAVRRGVADEEGLLRHERRACSRDLARKRDLERRRTLEAVVGRHHELPIRGRLHQLREPCPCDRAGGGADHVAGEPGVGRPRDLTGRLCDRGHADHELAGLLLAYLELLGTTQVLGGPLAQLADEGLDREADDRRDADPQQAARPVSRWVLGSADED